MLPNMSGLPREHRHVRNSGAELRRNVQQIGVYLATLRHTIEKCPLVRCQIEQESETLATKREGLVNPRVDLSSGGETVAGQADGKLVAKLARVAFDGVDGSGAPIVSPTGTYGEHGSLDPVPVELVDGKNTAGVEEIARCMPVDKRDELAGDDFVEVEDENLSRPHVTLGKRLHARHAEQGLARHVVHVDLQGGVAAERRGEAHQPLAAGMLVGLASDAVSLGSEETVECGVDGRAFGFHCGPIEGTDIVEVDIDRKPIETKVAVFCSALWSGFSPPLTPDEAPGRAGKWS